MLATADAGIKHFLSAVSIPEACLPTPPPHPAPVQFPLPLAPVPGTPEPWGPSILAPESGEK